jgi:N-acyl homoserine lactone hydrolase
VGQLSIGDLVRRLARIALVLSAVFVAACAGPGSAPSTGVERMYVFDCGTNRTNDLSRWTPGSNVGKPWEFSDNCYLIKHAKGYLLWDSGLSDAIAAMPEGLTGAGGAINSRVTKTLASQMAEIGVAPAQVAYLAFSHTHSDHVGNANYFTSATLYIQQTEYQAAFGPDAAKFGFVAANYEKLRASPVKLLNGDFDLFGDGSVTIIATPGHTPGHQSLLVKLPKTGAVILSGDMVHMQDNWDNRRVPSMNYNKDQSAQSMEKVAALMQANHAQLWINHDRANSERIPRAPKYIE